MSEDGRDINSRVVEFLDNSTQFNDELKAGLDSLQGYIHNLHTRCQELEAENAALKAALQPFERAAVDVQKLEHHELLLVWTGEQYRGLSASDFGALLAVSHLRAAREALKGQSDAG